MTLKAKVFESSMKSWESLCAEVSEFATGIGPDRLVNVSMSASGGGEWALVGSLGTIIVWYWE
ncbi:MAG TPA: hypothetical protein VFE29_06675 [Terriglobia bacterium]|jgi:hypothetical protein|nr:hypothetical protein [Terriglobia bacterium]